MPPEDFAKIEALLRVKLPEWYVSVLREYPLAEADESLFDSAEWTIRENERFRAEGYFGNPWPREFFIIGKSGAGDPFFIDLESDDKRIFWADHEGGPVPHPSNLPEMEISTTLDEYIDQTTAEIMEVTHEMERRRNRSWWKLWL